MGKRGYAGLCPLERCRPMTELEWLNLLRRQAIQAFPVSRRHRRGSILQWEDALKNRNAWVEQALKVA